MLKRITYLLILSLMLMCIWYARGYFYDESPDVGRDLFYSGTSREIPDENNMAVAIAGLMAPVDTNTIQYGRLMIDRASEPSQETQSNNEVQFIDLKKSNEINCKLEGAIEYKWGHCASAGQIKIQIKQNKRLLERYLALYKITDWQGVTAKLNTVHNLNTLLSAQIRLLILEGDTEKAYQLWRGNHLFITRVLNAEMSMIGKAVFLISEGMSLQSLEHLLYKNPEVYSQHLPDLITLLKPSDDLSRYNLKGAMRGEYAFIHNNTNNNEFRKLTHLEYIKNRIYRTQLEFLKKAALPAKTMTSNQQSMAEKHTHHPLRQGLTFLLPHGTSRIASNILISNYSNFFHLLKSMHSKNALINLLHLSVKIRHEKIEPTQIQDYLNNAGPQLNCPFTEKPMAYDTVKNTIYCAVPEIKNRREEVRL